MVTVTEFNAEVSRAVRQILGNKPWFRGVCMDGLDQFYPNKMGDAIEHAVVNTNYFDNPDFLKF